MRDWTKPPGIGLHSAEDRIKQIVFAFEFECLIQENTAEFFRTTNQHEVPTSTSSPLDGAAAIIGSIRIHAAKQLSAKRRTQDEFDFALAVYGLSTSKYADTAYDIDHRHFALISAGMAAARITVSRDMSFDAASFDKDAPKLPTLHYKPCIDWAHRNWSEGQKIQESRDLLDGMQDQFGYSVSFRSTLSLLESRLERFDAAFLALEGIVQADFKPFADHETPSRIAAAWKKKADLRWQKSGHSFHDLCQQAGPTPILWYRNAYQHYTTAFEISSSYYPGGNAVVTRFLANDPTDGEIANRVLAECDAAMNRAQTSDDRFWILATKGDMTLILDHDNAAEFYEAALEELPAEKSGMVQTTYDQICRLYKVFESKGLDRIRPVLNVFSSQVKFKLKPGPLGNCGDLFDP